MSLLSAAATDEDSDTIHTLRAENEMLRQALRSVVEQALEALTCTGEHDDPGHRCTHCDDYVDRNGPARAALRAALEQPDVQIRTSAQNPYRNADEGLYGPEYTGQVPVTVKTRHCDECEHFTRYETRHPTVCKLGHRPVFRNPKPNPHTTNWGWKRRCEDFKETNRGPDRLD